MCGSSQKGLVGSEARRARCQSSELLEIETGVLQEMMTSVCHDCSCKRTLETPPSGRVLPMPLSRGQSMLAEARHLVPPIS